ncbi:ABC transporter permease [Streptomyces sp. NPDC055078]
MAQSTSAPADARNRKPVKPSSGLLRRKTFLERVPTPVLMTVALSVLIGVWQLAVSFGWVSEYVMPTPADTAAAMGDVAVSLTTGGVVWDNFLITLQEIVLGLAIAAAVGIILGVAIAETVLGRKVLQPLMVALYAAPKVALAPVFVAWFGFGLTPKVVMAATIAFFPIMVDTAAGLAGVDEDQDKLFMMNRASRWQRFTKLKWPTALPFVFAGLKSGAVLAVIGAIVAEFMGGGEGLGVLVKTASVGFALDRVFALIILLSLIAFAVYILVDLVERKVVHWRATGFLPAES